MGQYLEITLISFVDQAFFIPRSFSVSSYKCLGKFVNSYLVLVVLEILILVFCVFAEDIKKLTLN